MELNQIQVSLFRNIDAAELYLGPGLNFIVGTNGSGKSSLLEAIYLLSSGRSFRTAREPDYIKAGQKKALVVARLTDGEKGITRIGMARELGATEYRVDGNRAGGLGELARRFPVGAISPETCTGFRGGAKGRRQFFEWGLFHVEPEYGAAWGRYTAVLRQRDEGLRSQSIDTDGSWLKQLAPLGERLHEYRKTMVSRLQAELSALLLGVGLSADQVALRYRKGWQSGRSLAATLIDARAADIKTRRTTVGAHRYDVSAVFCGEPELRRLSLGQLKFALILIRLAQVLLITKDTGQAPLLLLDDFYSEMDVGRSDLLLDYLHKAGYQVLLTDQGARLSERPGCKVFDIERGVVSERV